MADSVPSPTPDSRLTRLDWSVAFNRTSIHLSNQLRGKRFAADQLLLFDDSFHQLPAGGQAYVGLSRVRRLAQLHLRRALQRDDTLVERRARQFLTEGDTPTSVEETRALAATVYRETKKLKDKTSEEREYVERVFKAAELLLCDASTKLQECRQIEIRVRETEKRILAALDQAKKSGWFSRLFGRP